jgi:hypothetical protein
MESVSTKIKDDIWNEIDDLVFYVCDQGKDYQVAIIVTGNARRYIDFIIGDRIDAVWNGIYSVLDELITDKEIGVF